MKVHTWVNLQSCVTVEPLFQQVEVLTDCMNYAGYASFATWFFVTWLCISSCMLFSCVGAVFVEVSVSTIPSPTLVHRRESPSDEFVECRCFAANGRWCAWPVGNSLENWHWWEINQEQQRLDVPCLKIEKKSLNRGAYVGLCQSWKSKRKHEQGGSGVGLCWISSSHSNVCCEGRVADLIPSTCVLVGSIAPDSHHIHCTE